MAKSTLPPKPTNPIDDPKFDVGYRFCQLSTVMDGTAVALDRFRGSLPDDEREALVTMLENTLRGWAEEARELSDDVLTGWTPTKKAVA